METTQPLPDRFATILHGLRRAVAARMARNPAAVPLLLLLWGRLARVLGRFTILAERVRALPPARPCQRASRPENPHWHTRERLPNGFAWLVRLVPEAAVYGSQLQHLLTEPDFTALLKTAPQAGRLIRPLCRMLAVSPSPALALSSRPHRPAAPSASLEAATPSQPTKPPESANDRKQPALRWRGPALPGLASFRLARLFAPL